MMIRTAPPARSAASKAREEMLWLLLATTLAASWFSPYAAPVSLYALSFAALTLAVSAYQTQLRHRPDRRATLRPLVHPGQRREETLWVGLGTAVIAAWFYGPNFTPVLWGALVFAAVTVRLAHVLHGEPATVPLAAQRDLTDTAPIPVVPAGVPSAA